MDREVSQPRKVRSARAFKARPDFAQLFEAMPGQYMILDRDLIYVEANPAYCASTERTREEIVGRYVFEAFPPIGEGGRQIEESLRRVLATGIAEKLPLAAYPIPTADGGFRMKYWSCAHLPLFDENGDVAFVAQNAVDVTELQHLKTIAYGPDPGAPSPGESDLFQRALEITSVNESLAAETRGLRDLFMQAPGFMAVLMGPELVFAQVNNAYLQLIGHRPVIGRSLADALPEVIEQGFRDLLLSVMRSGTPHIGRATSVMLQRAPGIPLEERFADFIFQPIAGSDGEFVGVFIEGSDVTDRVRAEEALRRSEEQLRLATDAAEVGLWDVDGVTGDLYWPPVVKAMFGFSPDALVTMDDFYAGLHPEDREATTAAYEAAVDPARRALYDVEYRAVGKQDGAVRWVAAKGRAIFDKHGQCIRVIGTAIDISRRKIDEARLYELNATLERRVAEALAERKVFADVVEGTDSLVLVVDLDFNLLALNRAASREFERVYGVKPQVGTSLLRGLEDRPEHERNVREMWGRALAGEEFSTVEEFGDSKLDRRAYEIKFNVLRDVNGVQMGAFQFVTDVTHRVREQERLAHAEEQLRETQKLEAMGKLTGGVAHDFNNLLTPILGALDVLHRRKLGEEREQRLIQGALQSGERAKTLVQRLLAFARRQPLQPSAVDIRSVIEGMADLILSTTGAKVRVAFDMAEDLPPARADANQLEMAILNLSLNASDAMAQGGGTLRISADAQAIEGGHATKLAGGHYIRVSVIDTGVGMTKEVAARAAEPFFSTKGVGKGTGLGLSMVHGLASQLGGGVIIESEPGKGTTVELWVPQSDRPLASAGANVDRAVVARSNGHALIVDDEDLVRAAAADMLHELGFEVLEAASGEEALEILANGAPVDVVVTDHLMPGMSGTSLAYEVRRLWPQIRTLVISGYAEAEGIGPDLLRLNKPFRLDELAEALADAKASV